MKSKNQKQALIDLIREETNKSPFRTLTVNQMQLLLLADIAEELIEIKEVLENEADPNE